MAARDGAQVALPAVNFSPLTEIDQT